MSTIEYMQEVLAGAARGESVECRLRGTDTWFYCDPQWNWQGYEYRIMETPPSIDWDAVNPRFDWLAADENGTIWLYEQMPRIDPHLAYWSGGDMMIDAEWFTSLKRGTCNWDKSLVRRPV